MFNRVIFIFLLFFILASCAGTFDSVKRGLTGSKADSADEFLVKKKDPLILPPDYENLPSPDERILAEEENSIFKNTLETEIETENSSSGAGSVENSILKKIQSQ
tara:strand:- start:105 stop:419 length:315 start_codon:yes stop_codon:yes gene_type:complete